MALFKEVMPDLEFSHFNILDDEEVRQGIKGMGYRLRVRKVIFVKILRIFPKHLVIFYYSMIFKHFYGFSIIESEFNFSKILRAFLSAKKF